MYFACTTGLAIRRKEGSRNLYHGGNPSWYRTADNPGFFVVKDYLLYSWLRTIDNIGIT